MLGDRAARALAARPAECTQVVEEDSEEDSDAGLPVTKTRTGPPFICTGMTATKRAGMDGVDSVKAAIAGRVPSVRDSAGFREARRLLMEDLGGPIAVREELTRAGMIDAGTSLLTTGKQPFNVFARIAGGIMTQPGLEEEQKALGPYEDKYIVCSNLPENDSHWDSEEPQWVGKASMARRHRFLTIRDLHWQWFNALVFGAVPEEEGGADLREAIRICEEMQAAAKLYMRSVGGWSEDVGMVFHVFGHCSVNSLHLHMLDMSELGPTWHKLEYKNCPIECVIQVLQEELALKDARMKWTMISMPQEDAGDVADSEQQQAMLAAVRDPEQRKGRRRRRRRAAGSKAQPR